MNRTLHVCRHRPEARKQILADSQIVSLRCVSDSRASFRLASTPVDRTSGEWGK